MIIIIFSYKIETVQIMAKNSYKENNLRMTEESLQFYLVAPTVKINYYLNI